MGRAWMALLGVTTGCGSTISNQVFLDDADFLNALPGPEQFALAYPTEIDTSDCHLEGSDKSTFFCITADALGTGSSFLSTITTLTEVIRTLAPTERAEDLRIWGPGDWLEDSPGYFLRVEMSRSPTRSAYSWSFQLAETSAGPWGDEIVSGTHYAGELDVAAGFGGLLLDYSTLAEVVGTGVGGRVAVDYDARELTWIAVAAEGVDLGLGDAMDSAWTYQAREDGGGELVLDSPLNVDANPLPEQLALRGRWTVTGEGRGDALIHGGDLAGDPPRSASECWGATGALSWHTDELGWREDSGDGASCAFADGSFPALDTDRTD